MKANKYEIYKISDLLALSDEQIDRFCAELPSALKQAKAVAALIDSAAEALGVINSGQPTVEMLNPIKWIDSGRRGNTITFSDSKQEYLKLETHCNEQNRTV